MLFSRPAGPPMTRISDFITIQMNSLEFLEEDIEANHTIVSEESSI
jgi:hypothetical protein